MQKELDSPLYEAHSALASRALRVDKLVSHSHSAQSSVPLPSHSFIRLLRHSPPALFAASLDTSSLCLSPLPLFQPYQRGGVGCILRGKKLSGVKTHPKSGVIPTGVLENHGD